MALVKTRPRPTPGRAPVTRGFAASRRTQTADLSRRRSARPQCGVTPCFDERFVFQDGNEYTKLCHVTRTSLILPIESLRLSGARPPRPFPRPHLLDVLQTRDDGYVPPIVVEPPLPGDDRYPILTGEYWWRVAQAAQRASVTAVIETGVDDDTAARLRLNDEHHPSRPHDPMAAAARLADYLDETGRSLTSLAREFHTSRTALSHLLRLRSLHPDVQDALTRGALMVGHGRALAALPTTQQQRLAARVQQEQLSVRATERLAQGKGPLTPPASAQAARTDSGGSPASPDLLALERRLSEHLGLPVELRYHDRAGSLVLHFGSLEVFEGILERLQFTDD